MELPEPRRIVIAPDPVTPELDVIRRPDGGLSLGATLSGISAGVTVHPLGSPVHGLAVVEGEAVTLTGVQPVLPTGFDVIFEGASVVVPPTDVERFLAFYYPRLRRRMRVVSPDGSVDLPEPEPVRVHLRVVPHTVADIEVVASYAYPGADSPTLVPVDALDRWQDRDVGAEREVLARADSLSLLPGLRWAERSGGFRLQRSTHVRGLDAADFVRDVVPAWEADDDLVVAVDGELPAYEEATEAPLIEWRAGPQVPGYTDNDWLDLHVTVTVGGEAVPFEPLLRALVAGDRVMLLASGTWFSLDDPALDRLRRLIEEARELGDPVRDGVRVSRFQVDLFADLVELGVVDRESREWADRLVAIRDGVTVADAEVPGGVKAELRPYQREGYQWLATLWDAGLGAVLADDMGLGKTLQTLAVVQRAADRGDLDRPVLVVAPTSVLTTWRDEAERFTPGLHAVVVGETSRRRKQSLAEVVGTAQLVVTSYAVFRIDAEAFRALPWRALVLDEAQAVKNSASQTYHAARRLPAPFRLVVTGTPLENSLMDLWSLLSIAAPGLYPRRDRFSENYRKPVETGAEIGPERLDRLRRRIRPLLLRRTKEEVAAELPPKQVQILPVALHPVHQRIYDQHLQRERQRLLGLLDDPGANRVAILASLTRLRQLSLDPSLVDDSYAGRAVSAKVTELVDHLQELRQEGHRALVFSQFTGYLRLVERQLRDAGIETSYLDGSTRKRGDVIEGFRTGSQTAFLISLKAGGVGLTLTEADYVFVLDPWWNPATEAQAIDRAHRIGQTRPVMVYRMVSSGTIEDKVVALQERKRELFTRVVDGGEALGGAITPEDIRALLAGDED
ncbi:SNF2-like (fragment) [Nostocoides japonicum T1-X7]|uniref:SNF2-like n=1 Tax=Nostocoides japonicum T1-X7 TaxID=1194083 RepID=A0A077LZB8_9MICO